ncbi:hypothetical protein [Streptomyces sp. NPDC005498]|uniref:hypothetical protein n=1 Tax=Streptomyces sp. NPDC005498 TaxID=3364717 RepID=UPI0036885342
MTDPLDGEREALLGRVREYEQAATEQVDKLRTHLACAEDFAETLRTRLHQAAPARAPEALW